MITVTSNKEYCPLCNDNPITWPSQFWRHFRGEHIKKSDIVKTIEAINKSSMPSSKKKVILDEIKNFLFDQEDEITLLTDDTQGINGTYYLNDYLKSKNPFCREERQYAHFLANCLKRENGEIKKALDLLERKIIEVYFEATLLRDFWQKDKFNFNNNLWNYIVKMRKEDLENKTFNGTEKHAKFWNDNYSVLACRMMSAKPDLAILCFHDEKYKLSFVECKYTSKEAKYQNDSVTGEIGTSQIELQGYILEFLCNLGLFYIDKDNKTHRVEKGDVRLAQFVTQKKGCKNNRNNKHYEILIEDLVEYGYK